MTHTRTICGPQSVQTCEPSRHRAEAHHGFAVANKIKFDDKGARRATGRLGQRVTTMRG